MIGGVDDVYIHEVKRIGMRFLRMADGPLALRNYGPAMTFGVSDAATWHPELAKRVLAIPF